MKKKYTFENGKYIIIRDDTTYAIQAFRHGEIWEAVERDLVGDKLFHSVLNRIDDLEEQVSNAGWEASARHAQATGGPM